MRGILFAALENLGDLDGAALARRLHAGLDHGKIPRGPVAVGFRLLVLAHAFDELVELLANGVAGLDLDRIRFRLAALFICIFLIWR